MPKFIIKDMENIFVEEQKTMIKQLMMNLEQFPVGKTGSEVKNALYKMKKYVIFLACLLNVFLAFALHCEGQAVFHSQKSRTPLGKNVFIFKKHPSKIRDSPFALKNLVRVSNESIALRRKDRPSQLFYEKCSIEWHDFCESKRK